MKAFVILFLFVGILLIMHGIFEQKLKEAESKVKVEYKFIPRTYYEEQMSNSDVSTKMADIFNYESPWYDRTIGVLADTNIPEPASYVPHSQNYNKTFVF